MDRDILIFERGAPDRRCVAFPAAVDSGTAIPETMRRDIPPGLPEVSELELVRHYTALSQMNFSIDTHFYPLGSCTMKYNPRVHEKAARIPQIAGLRIAQGNLVVEPGTIALFVADVSKLPDRYTVGQIHFGRSLFASE